MTSSRPTVAATQCELEHEKVVGGGGESDRDGDTASGCSDGWRNRQGGMTGRGRQYGGRLMALVTGDPVVSSPEKPSLSCLLYIYIYIRIYQTVFRRFPLSAGQLTARMTASPANSVERAINFSPVEILARSVSVPPLPPSFFGHLPR